MGVKDGLEGEVDGGKVGWEGRALGVIEGRMLGFMVDGWRVGRAVDTVVGFVDGIGELTSGRLVGV